MSASCVFHQPCERSRSATDPTACDVDASNKAHPVLRGGHWYGSLRNDASTTVGIRPPCRSQSPPKNLGLAMHPPALFVVDNPGQDFISQRKSQPRRRPAGLAAYRDQHCVNRRHSHSELTRGSCVLWSCCRHRRPSRRSRWHRNHRHHR